jgi:hypothetical protein
LLLAILEAADRVDLSAALQGLVWSQLDRETLTAATRALIERTRSDEEAQLLMDLIDNLAEIGTIRTLPLANAYEVLDRLQALGRTLPRATRAATRVERRIRLEES